MEESQEDNNNQIIDVKKTDEEEILREIDEMPLPLVNVQRTYVLAITPVNFFAMGISIFLFSCPMMKWINFNLPSIATPQMFGGYCLLILGIYDWYQRNTFLFLIDYLFGLTNISFFYTGELGQYWTVRENGDINYLESPYFNTVRINKSYLLGTFFTLILVSLLICLVAIYKKGILYLINLGLVALACIFMMIWQYNHKAGDNHGWAETTSGYILLFTSLSFWVTGIFKLVNEVNRKKVIQFDMPDI